MTEKRYVGLHVHTKMSDGDLSPRDTVKYAKERGLSAVAITDHDTVESIEEALEAGKEFGIEVIPGVELTMRYTQRPIHVVGLDIDYKNANLVERLQEIKKDRKKRAQEILRQLNIKLGSKNQKITEEESIAGFPGCVGRMHIAKAMVKKKYVDSLQAAFDEYLLKLDLVKDAMNYMGGFSILDLAGGIPILAHPLKKEGHSLIAITEDRMEQVKILRELRAHGLIGVECARESREFQDAVKSQELLVTDGEDYHGPEQQEYADLGSLFVPYSLWLELKEERERRKEK